MTDFQHDFFVIGAGSGGVRAARLAAQRGRKVVVAEQGPTGGTCVNVGCIPKKIYSIAAHYGEAFTEARGHGWPVQAPALDWALLKARRAQEILRLNGLYEKGLDDAGALLLRGRARLLGPNEVEVDLGAGGGRQRHTARHILVATGGHSLRPDFPGADLAVSSDAMFDLPDFPKRLVVVGGGYIACEMASIFHGLGAQVTMLVRGNALLAGFDAELGAFLRQELGKKGVQVLLQTSLTGIRQQGDGLQVTLPQGAPLQADTVLLATGRGPNTAGLDLAEAGVELDKQGAVVVDARGQSRLPSVHAVGDATNAPQLTPVALSQAMVVVDRLFGDGQRPSFDPAVVPTAVFTHPGVASVGLSEAQARERGPVRVFRAEFKPLRHVLSDTGERSLVKLVVDARSDRVLGLHMVGAEAGEVVQGFAVALTAGATKAQFDATLGIHPTLAEEFLTLREPVA